MAIALFFLCAAATFRIVGARDEAAAEQALMAARESAAKPIPQITSSLVIDLPPFDGVALPKAMMAAADQAKLPLQDIAFAFDEGRNEPYRRYRARFSVAANYRAIRLFVRQLQIAAPNVVLDSISCTRGDIASPSLTCEVGLSAFYRRAENG